MQSYVCRYTIYYTLSLHHSKNAENPGGKNWKPEKKKIIIMINTLFSDSAEAKNVLLHGSDRLITITLLHPFIYTLFVLKSLGHIGNKIYK